MNSKLQQWHALFCRIPNDLIAVVGRFSIAGVFWLSGQTKIDGFAMNVISGDFQWGWPRLSDTAVFLFQEEYALPLLAPTTAAVLAAFAEHLLPVLVFIGLGTRYAATGLLAMTLVIQIFVYPGAYVTHGVWACVLLYLMAHGAGRLSVDYWLARRLNG
ncbi:hypothetical protein BGP77_14825 [Saccharospirillum sp. MSK14-1]|uniref:DoxX family protein n=1 Tax=Saccharospirillum sp. MSK14-1 TaxID=1897632 RepID=UPI000D33B78E|nr:DoxX family protein [Saccharospirillum sp. MSK14-1]PTY37752.1 hypothetical protein BGP77_14825 [Saccharospirillum sp. MSK14-1]